MLPRPRAFWTGVAAGIAALNLWANAGEPNGDTISENTRELVQSIPHGEELLAGAIAAAGVGFWKHICKAPS